MQLNSYSRAKGGVAKSLRGLARRPIGSRARMTAKCKIWTFPHLVTITKIRELHPTATVKRASISAELQDRFRLPDVKEL